MTDLQWKAFCDFKRDLAEKCREWADFAPELKGLQKEAAKIAKTPDYPFENPVVYNRALDEITQNDQIKLIVIGDNPGKDEQLTKNQKYLVGQAGKIAESYFKKHPELGIDFRKNVIILNKTPIHSAKTNQLKTIARLGGEKIASLLQESQIWMAERTVRLHRELAGGAGETAAGMGSGSTTGGAAVDVGSVGLSRITAAAGESAGSAGGAAVDVGSVGLSRITAAAGESAGSAGGAAVAEPNAAPEVWLVGYSELKDKGIFTPYRDHLKAAYITEKASLDKAAPQTEIPPQGSQPHPIWDSVYVFQHFSMNRFTIDLGDYIAKKQKEAAPLITAIHELGKVHREEIFGQ